MPERRAAITVPNNLPLQLTTFVGRSREKAEVAGLLASNRLLTLMGAGGAGKTRLALAVAADALPQFPDGVWFVEFAPLADPALVTRAAAAVLGVADQGEGALLQVMLDALRSRRLLLILDNCEHLIAEASRFAEALLRSCPDVRLLATSREALGIPGETAWRVPSLSLPDARHAQSLDELRRYEAIQLFEARAQSGRPGFALTSANGAAVEQICRRLDGIPLAIELAAARVNVLSPEQLAVKLDDRFRLLTGGSRSALPRQQTLRAAMDWSYELLPPAERAVLRRLSVFAGGCTLEAAEAVCSMDGIGVADVLDLLGRLVDKSLVLTDLQDGETRYRLLETVRQYARDRLLESGDAAEARRRHRDWYLGWMERKFAVRDGRYGQPDQGQPDLAFLIGDDWLDQLDREHDNFRAALEWSAGESDDADAEVRLAAPLWRLWHFRGYFAEGRRWLEHAISRTEGTPTVARRVALHGGSLLAWRQADWPRAKYLAEQELEESRAAGDRTMVAWAYINLGLVAMRGGQDFAEATSRFEEALAMARTDEKRWLAAMALAQLSAAARYQGQYDLAISRIEECLAIFEAGGAGGQISYAERLRGHALLERGDLDGAAHSYAESLRRSERGRRGPTWSAVECLEGLGGIALARGQCERAARLFGVAEVFRQTRGYPRRAHEAGRYVEQIAALRTALGEARLQAALTAGGRLTLEDAADYALASAEPEKAGARGQPVRPGADDPLTAREREVAALVAGGKTNREIAATLVISERTADAHVQNILNKLGFTARTQIAAWAVERGLQDRPIPGSAADVPPPPSPPPHARRGT